MKKIILRVLIVLFALLLVYIGINQFDTGKPTHGITISELFPTANFDKSNGFYRLWTLPEPAGTDIESDEIIQKYRRLHDPELDNAKYVKEWNTATKNRKYKMNSSEEWEAVKAKRNEIVRKGGKWTDMPRYNTDPDWGGVVLENKQYVREVQDVMALHLERFQKMVDSEIFEDFTFFSIEAPIPNLLTWLHISKQYTTLNMLDAMEGDWEKGVNNLLAQVRHGKKSVKTARTLITNLVGKAVTKIGLYGLASLMNQKDCPPEVYGQVLNGLEGIGYEEYGSRTPMMAEGLFAPEAFDMVQDAKKSRMGVFDRILYALFYQENRTQTIHNGYMREIVKLDQTLPYQWKETPKAPGKQVKGWFWWLQNPMGKLSIDSISYPNFHATIFKSYALKAVYDMTKISAELHMNYTADKPVQEILDGLETYTSLKDPCSGKPYKWHETKQILYSIGTDRKDNDGETQGYQQIEGVDFHLPVILFLRD